jgi:hypothetical protein
VVDGTFTAEGDRLGVTGSQAKESGEGKQALLPRGAVGPTTRFVAAGMAVSVGSGRGVCRPGRRAATSMRERRQHSLSVHSLLSQ